MQKIAIKRLSLAAFCALSMSLNLGANEADLELNAIEVVDSLDDIKNQKVGEIVKDSRKLSKQQVSDTKDMVKYETGISVVETGRMGASGYAIRGVDENRVAISIDGLNQAETLSSQGFRELFEGYGNFNNTRNGVEIENIKQVNITKGADSIKTGSGSLGGSVMFETKDARDFLIDKDWFYGFRVGHSSVNEQRMHSHTLAARFKWFDFLIVKTDRDGSETKNFGYKSYDETIQGKKREKPDPYHITQESTLLKFSFMPNDTNRFTFMSDKSVRKQKGHDFSYTLKFSKNINNEESELRHTDDTSTRDNLAISYENFDENPLWDILKVTASKQSIKLRARTDDYCDGNEKCDGVKNKSGLQVVGANVVDRYGGGLSVDRSGVGSTSSVTDSKGNKFSSADVSLKIVNDFEFDCSIFNCNGITTLYKNNGYSFNDYEKFNLDLSKSTRQTHTAQDGKTYYFDVTEHTFNDKKFKRVLAQSKFKNFLDQDVYSKTNDYNMVIPNSKGYIENDWKERDLNTNTKQINLEVIKEFQTKSLEHTFKYGGVYAITEKTMVNKSGYGALESVKPKWWVKKNLYEGESCGFNSLLCPRVEPETSFLIPVETKSGALFIDDEIQVNDMVAFGLSYRKDRIKHNPKYIPGVTPKIADDMVKGIFVPRPAEPRWWDSKYDATGGRNSPLYKADLDEYNSNAAKNIAFISQPKEYKQDSYALNVTLDPFEFIRLQGKYSKGFRAPTSDEIYFTFKHPDFTILPNPRLDAEIAKTKEFAITLHNSPSFATLSFFRTDYSNFIDLDYLGFAGSDRNGNIAIINQNGKIIPDPNAPVGKGFSLWQNVNRTKAYVNGVELNARVSLDQLYDRLQGFNFGWKFTYQVGRFYNEAGEKLPINAIQPKTSVYNLGYVSKNDKFGVDLYITQVSAKADKDTYNMYHKEERAKDSYVKYRSNAYTIADLIAFYRPIKNLNFTFGVYNITNKRYLTWENARSIRPFGTSNMIDKDTGGGIARFYAPGRNFKINFELTF